MGEEDDFLDACGVDFELAATDEDPELLALFAEALGPDPEKTVEEVEAEWKAIFDGS